MYLFNLRLTEINEEEQINVVKYIDNKRYVVTTLLL